MALPTIFISHSGQDNAWSECVVTQLKAVGFNVWFDKNSLEGGDTWIRQLETEIPARDVFVLIISPDSLSSQWVQREIHLAMITQRRIIPIMHRPTQVTSFLQTIQIIDGVNRDCHIIGQMLVDVLQGTPTAPPTFPMPAALAKARYEERIIDHTRVILPPLCEVAGGPFIMGSDPRRDPAAYPDELPQFQVNLPSFRIAAYPVSVAEYMCALTVGAVLEPPVTDINPLPWREQTNRIDAPVVGVDWQNALAYVNWLTRLTRDQWSLPTEAEWEKAARGIDGRIFPWGNTWDVNKANTQMMGLGKPTAIGKYFNVSPFGVFETVGNVWEWTRTEARHYPYQVDGRDDVGDTSAARVLRGGSYASGNLVARIAFRTADEPATGTQDRGFRLRVG